MMLKIEISTYLQWPTMFKVSYLFLLLLPGLVQAELTIEITEGMEAAAPIAVVPFRWSGAKSKPSQNLTQIISGDLSRSGQFKALPEEDMLTKPTKPSQVKFRNWQALGQEFLVIGTVKQSNSNRYKVAFRLFDVYKGSQLTGYQMTVTENDLRRAAHRISDLIFEKITGTKGAFGSHIAYVTSHVEANNNKIYKLQVADADGYNPKTITSSKEPVMSPSWSPDGKRIAYVSFEKKASGIYIQTLANGQREQVSSYPGINGAPAWSPDGNKLALTLSKEGSPDIYILELAGRKLRKLTESYAIDTEPTWSPDGKNIVFTSDRGGKPQLYMKSLQGGSATRVTFDGDYNARGVFSADGRWLAMVNADQGNYRIACMNLSTKKVNVLTSGRLDESPSFAPNGSMILYASREQNRGQLSAVSIDGKMHQNIVVNTGEVREPAWSPM